MSHRLPTLDYNAEFEEAPAPKRTKVALVFCGSGLIVMSGFMTMALMGLVHSHSYNSPPGGMALWDPIEVICLIFGGLMTVAIFGAGALLVRMGVKRLGQKN